MKFVRIEPKSMERIEVNVIRFLPEYRALHDIYNDCCKSNSSNVCLLEELDLLLSLFEDDKAEFDILNVISTFIDIYNRLYDEHKNDVIITYEEVMSKILQNKEEYDYAN